MADKERRGLRVMLRSLSRVTGRTVTPGTGAQVFVGNQCAQLITHLSQGAFEASRRRCRIGTEIQNSKTRSELEMGMRESRWRFRG